MILLYNPMKTVVVKKDCLKSGTCSQEWLGAIMDATKMRENVCATHFLILLMYGHCSLTSRVKAETS